MINQIKANVFNRKITCVGFVIVAVAISTCGCTSKPVEPTQPAQPSQPTQSVQPTKPAETTPEVVKETPKPASDGQAAANQPTAANPVDTYDAYLRSLNHEDVATLSLAMDKFNALASSKNDENDQMLESYVIYYNRMIETLNGKDPESISKLDPALLKQNGLRLNESEAGSFVGNRPSYLFNHFSKVVSAAKREVLAIRMEEDLQVGTEDSGTYLLEDAGLSISWDQLSDRIIRWEKYLKSYPKSRDRQEILGNIKAYLWIYTASPLDNTPVFVQNKLSSDVQKSYERFIQKYPDSEYFKVIDGYYKSLKQNKFKLNQKSIDHLKTYKVDTEMLQQWLDMKW